MGFLHRLLEFFGTPSNGTISPLTPFLHVSHRTEIRFTDVCRSTIDHVPYRKPESFPGLIDTSSAVRQPRFKTTSRKSTPFVEEQVSKTEKTDEEDVVQVNSMSQRKSNGVANGNGAVSNGKANGKANGTTVTDKKTDVVLTPRDWKIDDSGFREFGGSFGTAAAMIGFPLLMWFLWVGQVYYNGQLPRPAPGQSFGDFVNQVVQMALEVRTHSVGWLIFKALIFSHSAPCQLGRRWLYIGASSSGNALLMSLFQVFGRRACLCLISTASVSLTTATVSGLGGP